MKKIGWVELIVEVRLAGVTEGDIHYVKAVVGAGTAAVARESSILKDKPSSEGLSDGTVQQRQFLSTLEATYAMQVGVSRPRSFGKKRDKNHARSRHRNGLTSIPE